MSHFLIEIYLRPPLKNHRWPDLERDPKRSPNSTFQCTEQETGLGEVSDPQSHSEVVSGSQPRLESKSQNLNLHEYRAL